MFARNSDFFADDEVGAYVAFIAIAKKKGGRPIKFVLYRFLSVGPKGMFESVEFSDHQVKEAKEAFPFGPILYRPIEEESEGIRDLIKNQEFPRTRINPWRKTTDWLSDVAVGGSRYPKGVWVKLKKRPYTWRKSGPRKKKRIRLRFGELGHILLKLKMGKKEAEAALDSIGEDDGPLSEQEFDRRENELNEELDGLEKKMTLLQSEMKYVRDKKFSCPVAP